MISRSTCILILCGATLATRLFGEPATNSLSPRFAPCPPCPVVTMVAGTNHIPLTGIDELSLDVPRTLNPGDSLTALVTLFEKNARRTQWLLYMQVVEPTAKEKSAKPPPPMTFPGLNGGKHEFASSPAWVNLRTLGPFAEVEPKRKPPKALDKSARFVMNQGFLSLGFDRAARVMQVAEAKENANTNRMTGGNEPAKNFKTNAAVLFSTEDERALVGVAPALISYFDIMQHTAGLDEIFYQLVKLPSMWSIARHIGVDAGFQLPAGPIAEVNPAPWTLQTTNAAYTFPMALLLNQQPALNVTMVATAPQPPLLSCAGVLGVLAEKPGDKDLYLTVRVLSARHTKPRP